MSQEQTPVARSHFSIRYPYRFAKILCPILIGIAGLIVGGCASKGGKGNVVSLPAGSFTPKWLADIGLEGDEATDV
jgi:hypothetical protein